MIPGEKSDDKEGCQRHVPTTDASQIACALGSRTGSRTRPASATIDQERWNSPPHGQAGAKPVSGVLGMHPKTQPHHPAKAFVGWFFIFQILIIF